MKNYYARESHEDYQENIVQLQESDEEMSDEDPRTNTQLMNNESLAQCSQDTYEDPSNHVPPLVQQTEVSRPPLSLQSLRKLSIHEMFNRNKAMDNE